MPFKFLKSQFILAAVTCHTRPLNGSLKFWMDVNQISTATKSTVIVMETFDWRPPNSVSKNEEKSLRGTCDSS